MKSVCLRLGVGIGSLVRHRRSDAAGRIELPSRGSDRTAGRGVAGARNPTTWIGCSRPSRSIPTRCSAQMLLCAAKPAKVGGAQRVDGRESRRSRAASCRTRPRSPGSTQSFAALVLFPDVVELDGIANGLDDAARRGVRGRPLGGLRQHPAAADEGESGREAEEHAAAGCRDQDDVDAASR